MKTKISQNRERILLINDNLTQRSIKDDTRAKRTKEMLDLLVTEIPGLEARMNAYANGNRQAGITNKEISKIANIPLSQAEKLGTKIRIMATKQANSERLRESGVDPSSVEGFKKRLANLTRMIETTNSKTATKFKALANAWAKSL
jgi:predicted phage tail protein